MAVVQEKFQQCVLFDFGNDLQALSDEAIVFEEEGGGGRRHEEMTGVEEGEEGRREDGGWKID